MHQATVRGFDIRKAVFAWLDACNRKPKAELVTVHSSIKVVKNVRQNAIPIGHRL
jgi:hypothetical protein